MKEIKPKLIKEHSSPIFYYIRDKQHNPIITICLIKTIDGIVCRGIAIRNDKDQISKSKGREISFKRAVSALYKEGDSLFIDREETMIKIENIDCSYVFSEINIYYKSIYNSRITEFERSLFDKVENKKEK